MGVIVKYNRRQGHPFLLGEFLGRRDLFLNPFGPSACQRLSHLRTVFQEQLNCLIAALIPYLTAYSTNLTRKWYGLGLSLKTS